VRHPLGVAGGRVSDTAHIDAMLRRIDNEAVALLPEMPLGTEGRAAMPPCPGCDTWCGQCDNDAMS